MNGQRNEERERERKVEQQEKTKGKRYNDPKRRREKRQTER